MNYSSHDDVDNDDMNDQTFSPPPRDDNVNDNDVDDDYFMIRIYVDADYMYLNIPTPWW